MSNERFIDEPPAGASGWRDVWSEDRQYRASGLTGLIRGLIRRFTRTDLERQRDFNLVVLDLLDDLRADTRAQVEGLRSDLEALRLDVRKDVEAVSRDARRDVEAVLADLRRVEAVLLPIATKRNDALIAALDQKIETLAVRLRDVTNPVVFGERPAPADYTYRRIEDALRGSSAALAEGFEPYLEIASAHPPLLDVGCGRGELLAACRDAGIQAVGFDTNERSVADLTSRGLSARVGGVPECFADVPDASIGSIAAIHVVEHLPPDVLFALFREAARVLKAGGMLMIETPNAESMLMSATDFWRDPTHLAPRHPAALTVLAREHGFAIEELRAVHEFPEGTRIPVQPSDPPELQRVIQAVNDRLFAPQDLRLVARKA